MKTISIIIFLLLSLNIAWAEQSVKPTQEQPIKDITVLMPNGVCVVMGHNTIEDCTEQEAVAPDTDILISALDGDCTVLDKSERVGKCTEKQSSQMSLFTQKVEELKEQYEWHESWHKPVLLVIGGIAVALFLASNAPLSFIGTIALLSGLGTVGYGVYDLINKWVTKPDSWLDTSACDLFKYILNVVEQSHNLTTLMSGFIAENECPFFAYLRNRQANTTGE